MIRSVPLALIFAAHASAGVITLPDPSSPMPEGGTVVWSPLFQATWDAMNAHLGGKPASIDPPNELMVRLDAFDWKADAVMPEGAWKTWAGKATPDFLKRVNSEAREMVGEDPFRLSGEGIPNMMASSCGVRRRSGRISGCGWGMIRLCGSSERVGFSRPTSGFPFPRGGKIRGAR